MASGFRTCGLISATSLSFNSAAVRPAPAVMGALGCAGDPAVTWGCWAGCTPAGACTAPGAECTRNGLPAAGDLPPSPQGEEGWLAAPGDEVSAWVNVELTRRCGVTRWASAGTGAGTSA